MSFQATKFTVLCYRSDSKLIRHLVCNRHYVKPFYLLFYLLLLWVACPITVNHYKDAITEVLGNIILRYVAFVYAAFVNCVKL